MSVLLFFRSKPCKNHYFLLPLLIHEMLVQSEQEDITSKVMLHGTISNDDF